MNFRGMQNINVELPRWFLVFSFCAMIAIYSLAPAYFAAKLDLRFSRGSDTVPAILLVYMGAFVAGRLLTNGIWWAAGLLRPHGRAGRMDASRDQNVTNRTSLPSETRSFTGRVSRSLGLKGKFSGLADIRAEQPRGFAIFSSWLTLLMVGIAPAYSLIDAGVRFSQGPDAFAAFAFAFLGAFATARLVANGLWWVVKSFRHRQENGQAEIARGGETLKR